MTEPQTELIALDLTTICEGAAIEAFGVELGKLLESIHDGNTSATKTRTIVLELQVTPKEDRTQLNLAFKCRSSLAGLVPASSRMFIAKDEHGNLYAVDRDPRQTNLFTPPTPKAVAEPIVFRKAEG